MLLTDDGVAKTRIACLTPANEKQKNKIKNK
jgi:hypothetical protein